MMVRDVLEKIVGGGDLSPAEMSAALTEIIDEGCPPAQIAGFLMALRAKGESVDELVGAAVALRDRALALPDGHGAELDVVGTGGDGSGSINLSTAAALIAAAVGVRVAKHGNRSISSQCGSADVLEALGIPVGLGPSEAARALDRAGFCFLFAPVYHPAMKAVAQVRRDLAVPTMFNMLGPLTNPAGVPAQLVGIGHPEKLTLYAGALRRLGVERGFVVSATAGLDEIAPSGVSLVVDLADKASVIRPVRARDFGLAEQPLSSIQGGTPEMNAAILRDVFAGDDVPARTAVLMNASAALVAAGVADDFRDGVRLAAEAVDSGRVMDTLTRLQAAEVAA